MSVLSVTIMAAKVNKDPILSLDPTYLTTVLMTELRAHAQRLNLAIPGDGSETPSAPVILKSYTVATLPDPAKYAHGIIYVSNGTSNKRLAVSDGTNWRFPDGNIVT